MSSKKKILIRIGSLRHGGAEKVLVTFLKNLPPDKFEIDLLLNLYSGKYLTEVPSWINVLYLNKGEMITTNRLQDLPEKIYRKIYQGLLKKFPKLLYKGKLKGKKYDVEFAAIHGMRDEILNSPLQSSKKLVWIHNDLTQTEFHDYTEKEFRKFFGFDKILVISEKIQQDFEKAAKTDIEKQKIIRIYNPLDTEEILEKAKAENTLNPTTNKTFISVGTVFPQKGFDRLLKAHKRLLDEGLSHQIMIVGDGYDFDNTMLRIGSMNMLLHGVENPVITYRDSLSQDYAVEEEKYSLILANPPFAGSINIENAAKDLLAVVNTKKTELLFMALF
jgi:glycosyltransferase involved in cell wall biosynthesis